MQQGIAQTTAIPKPLQELVERARVSPALLYTRFLPPDQFERLHAYANNRETQVLRLGGGEDAERAIAGLRAQAFAELPLPEELPFTLLRIRFDSRFFSLTHSDMLGAILALGIERECLGDIRFDEQGAIVAVTNAMGRYLTDGLTKVGNAPVCVESFAGELPPAEKGERRKINVPSLRLDAIMQQAAHLPREKAQQLIRAGGVSVNWEPALKPDRTMREGDVISVRGHGRIRILELAGASRKDRLFLLVETFLR